MCIAGALKETLIERVDLRTHTVLRVAVPTHLCPPNVTSRLAAFKHVHNQRGYPK
jgi:hypothetical protein